MIDKENRRKRRRNVHQVAQARARRHRQVVQTVIVMRIDRDERTPFVRVAPATPTGRRNTRHGSPLFTQVVIKVPVGGATPAGTANITNYRAWRPIVPKNR